MTLGGWLVHCPAAREPYSGQDMSGEVRVKGCKLSVVRQQVWAKLLLKAQADSSGDVAYPPFEHKPVSRQIRLFVLQELRLLLGGETWDPVLVSSTAGVPAKLFKITSCLPKSTSTLSMAFAACEEDCFSHIAGGTVVICTL